VGTEAFVRPVEQQLDGCCVKTPKVRGLKNGPALTILPRSARIIEAIAKVVVVSPNKWACGAAGSALPWHGRGRRFDPDQVHQLLTMV
jgi:hypothetical protein